MGTYLFPFSVRRTYLQFLRRCRGNHRIMRLSRINVSRQITLYLGIDEIEFTATIKYCFIDSPSVHTLSQTLQQPVAILGAVIAMLFIFHNIESYDIILLQIYKLIRKSNKVLLIFFLSSYPLSSRRCLPCCRACGTLQSCRR